MLKTAEDIANYIQHDEFMMNALRAARTLDLPGWFLGAGFVRETVWNIQHGFVVDHKFNDIDLGYYDETHQSEKGDEALSLELRKKFDINWEIVNQAYAHKYNNVSPYTSAVDGLAHWVETPHLRRRYARLKRQGNRTGTMGC